MYLALYLRNEINAAQFGVLWGLNTCTTALSLQNTKDKNSVVCKNPDTETNFQYSQYSDFETEVKHFRGFLHRSTFPAFLREFFARFLPYNHRFHREHLSFLNETKWPFSFYFYKPNKVFTLCLPSPSWTFLLFWIQSLRCLKVINLTIV
jgi:hypothetical protein